MSTPGATFRRGARARGLVLLLAGVTVAGCATRGFRPPSGPGTPAPDAAAWLEQATARCRNASTFVGNTTLSGRAGRETIPSVGIGTGLTRDGGIVLDARAVGSQVFWLSGRDGQATLYLREDRLFVTAAPEDIVEALIGVKLGPGRLLAMLTGCMSRDLSVERAQAYDDGRLASVTTPDGTVYLRRDNGTWRVRAGTFDGLTVEVVEAGSAFPAELRITTAAGAATPVDLRIRLSPPLRVNDPAGIRPESLAQAPPAEASPMTLEELRAAGPLRSRDGGG